MDIIYSRGSCTSAAGSEVLHFYTPSCSSTMELAYLISRSRSGCITALRSDTQKQGRGRIAGRTWEDEPGKSLLCTWSVPADNVTIPLQMVPLAAGAALLSLLNSCGIGDKLKVKWPNDLLFGDRKLCGVLCEAKQNRVMVGIGLNVYNQRLTGSLGRAPVSIEEITGKGFDLDSLSCRISRTLTASLAKFSPKEVEHCLYGAGQPIVFQTGRKQAVVHGLLSGVAPDGALLIETVQGVQAYYSGEIISICKDGLDS